MPTSFHPTRPAAAAWLALTLAGACLNAQAGVSIASTTDTVAGRAAYTSAGTTQTQFDWNAAYAAPNFTPGSLGSALTLGSYSTPPLPDGTTNMVVGANPGANLVLGNWIDGDVFDTVGTAAAADLAINGVESFNLLFGRGHQSIGLAIASGTGNLPREYDLTGATFLFSAFDDGGALLGSATLILQSGSPQRVWMTLNADSEFRRIEVRELGASSIADQYFSNIYTSVQPVSAVPEPGSLLLIGLGLGALALRATAKLTPAPARPSRTHSAP